jgi:hypothetical protein
LSTLILVFGVGLSAQDLVPYTTDFKFSEGIYLNFEQVKENNPIPKAKLLSSTDYNDKDFFKNLFDPGKVYFYDNIGVRQEVEVSSIWGYARNGVLYIQIQGNFNRITYIGSICHFVADITTYDSRIYSPYSGYYPYYYSPYSYGYSPYSYGYYPYGSFYSPYGSYYSPYGSPSTRRSEVVQFMIDFESGEILEFTLDNTKRILMKDPDLYEQFIREKKSKQKDLMFVYLRKYNEKHQLMLPVR